MKCEELDIVSIMKRDFGSVAYATICSCSAYNCCSIQDGSVSLISLLRLYGRFSAPNSPKLSDGTSLTKELTQETSGSSTGGANVGVPMPLFRIPNEADFLSLLRSLPCTPQSSFPSGEFQSERWEDIVAAEFAAPVNPGRRVTAARSMKLWLRLAKAADLEFITAAATALDESKPKEVGFFTGEEDRLAG